MFKPGLSFLKKLKELMDKELISKEEYDKKKIEILNEIYTSNQKKVFKLYVTSTIKMFLQKSIRKHNICSNMDT